MKKYDLTQFGKIAALVLLMASLSACEIVNNASSALSKKDDANLFQHQQFDGLFVSAENPTHIQTYVQEVVAKLALNMTSVAKGSTIAVTHFSEANSDFSLTSNLGFALAESFLRELHESGFNPVDFKVTNAVRVTPTGDFALSRDFLELANELDSDYLLVGTMIAYKNGMLINARIVDSKSKAIVATGNSFIPQQHVNMLVHFSQLDQGGSTA